MPSPPATPANVATAAHPPGPDRAAAYRCARCDDLARADCPAVDPSTEPHVVYDGKCTLCGWEGRFEAAGGFRGAGGRFPCGGCGATLRFRDEAAVLVQELGRGLHLTLDALVDDERVR